MMADATDIGTASSSQPQPRPRRTRARAGMRSAMSPPPQQPPPPPYSRLFFRIISFASHAAQLMAATTSPGDWDTSRPSGRRRRRRTPTRTALRGARRRGRGAGPGGPGGGGVDDRFGGRMATTMTTTMKRKRKREREISSSMLLRPPPRMLTLLLLMASSLPLDHFTWSPRPVLVLAEVVASSSPPATGTSSSSFSSGYHLRDRYRKYLAAAATTPSSLYASSSTASSPGAVIGGRGGTRTCGAGSRKKTALCSPESWGPRDRPYHPPGRREGGRDDWTGAGAGGARLCATLLYEGKSDDDDAADESSSTGWGEACALMLFERWDGRVDDEATGRGFVNGTNGPTPPLRCVSISRGEGNKILVRPCHYDHARGGDASNKTTGQIPILHGGGRGKGRRHRSRLKNETMSATVAGHDYHHRYLNSTRGRRRKDVAAADAPPTTMAWPSLLSPSNFSSSSAAVVDVEGIYGVYNLPSGPHLVLILESEAVYTSPPPPPPPPPNLAASTDSTGTDAVGEGPPQPQPPPPPPLLNLRRVVRMDVVPIPGGGRQKPPAGSSSMSSARRREEARQLRLLRRALRAHDLYYSPSSSSPPRPRHRHGGVGAGAGGGEGGAPPRCDATNTLQRRLLIHTTATAGAGAADRGGGRSSSTPPPRRRGAENWERVKRDAYGRPPGRHHAEPDSRFFWNEDLLPPLFEDCRLPDDDDEDGADEETEADDGEVVAAADWGSCNDEDGGGDRGDCVARTLGDWVVPCTSAFVGVARDVSPPVPPSGGGVVIPHLVYDEVLISRRSRHRAGTRFTRRGADATGAVANYAETEQLVFVKTNATATATGGGGGNDNDGADGGGDASSPSSPHLAEVYGHVQTRGSIPLLWSSPADVRTYAPRVRMGIDPLSQARALRAHVMEQIRLYSLRAPPPSSTAGGVGVGDDDRNGLGVDGVDLAAASASAGVPTVTFVNLVDKKHDQGRLGRAFDAVLGAVVDVHGGSDDDDDDNEEGGGQSPSGARNNNNVIPTGSVRHVWFDFHAECRGGRWNRLRGLLSSVQSDLDDQGYLAAVPSWSTAEGRGKDDGESSDTTTPSFSWKIITLQGGVVRTNCMDCLDRTNVVQSIFGRYVLFRQLQRRDGRGQAFLPSFNNAHAGAAGRRDLPFVARGGGRTLPLEWVVAFTKRDPLRLPWTAGEMAHRHLWADNADAISRLYAGTRALKGDFTRTGVRTRRGAMEDGVNSLTRYYLNNFADADRQEGVDLVTGTLPFANVDDDDDDGVVVEEKDVGGSADSSSSTLGDESIDDNISTTHERSVMLGRVGRQTTGGSRRTMKAEVVGEELDLLRRLPPEDPGKPPLRDLLLENMDSVIDGRAASDLPWWVGEGDDESSATDGEDGGTTETGTKDAMGKVVALHKQQRTVFAEEPDDAEQSFFVYPRGGYVLGALLAMSHATVAAAAAVLLILLPGLSSLDGSD